MARTDVDESRCDIEGTMIWNDHFNMVNQHIYKYNLRTNISKGYLETYNIYTIDDVQIH